MQCPDLRAPQAALFRNAIERGNGWGTIGAVSIPELLRITAGQIRIPVGLTLGAAESRSVCPFREVPVNLIGETAATPDGHHSLHPLRWTRIVVHCRRGDEPKEDEQRTGLLCAHGRASARAELLRDSGPRNAPARYEAVLRMEVDDGKA